MKVINWFVIPLTCVMAFSLGLLITKMVLLANAQTPQEKVAQLAPVWLGPAYPITLLHKFVEAGTDNVARASIQVIKSGDANRNRWTTHPCPCGKYDVKLTVWVNRINYQDWPK